MNDNLRDLLEEEISDETAYHLGNFLYELALAFESIYLGQIRRYKQSKIELNNELITQNSNQGVGEEEGLQDLF
jgi:hypothetical protein